MTHVWQSAQIGSVFIKNRFIRSATFEGLGLPTGHCQPKINLFYKQLTSIGLIISGHLFVDPVGQAGPRQLGIQNNSTIDGLLQLTKTVHDAGGRIFAQLSHAGAHADTNVTQLPAKGPSKLDLGKYGTCEEMALDDISQVICRFSDAARRAKMADFDGIQLHAAHGYLISQFLSPWYNHREDQYGGSLTNRARLLLDIIDAIKAEVGDDYPITVKLNSEDFLESGFTQEEMVEVAKMLEAKFVSAIELSGGCATSQKWQTPVRPLDVDENDIEDVYYLTAAARYKQSVNIPLMLVGGIKSMTIANELLERGLADFISLSRPLICEPNLVDRWQQGNTAPSICIRCSKCFQTLKTGNGVSCAIRQALI